MKTDKKKIMQKDAAIKGIESFLTEMKLTEEEFKARIRGTKGAHRKITEGILENWRRTEGFGLAKIPFAPRGGTYGIDVIGRDYERGKILMSVEVDTWHLPYASWMKLLDIRSDNKFWIYVTNYPEQKARGNFKESIGEINALISSRKEEKSTLGNFVAFLKTSSVLEKEIINLIS